MRQQGQDEEGHVNKDDYQIVQWVGRNVLTPSSIGIGEVELGAVRFHLPGKSALPDGLFDFEVEMPPHEAAPLQC